MRAPVPLYYGEVEGERIYHRTTFIHEISCGQVGSHLYRRMCCAGRSERSASVGGGGASGRGSGLLPLRLLTFSIPFPAL